MISHAALLAGGLALVGSFVVAAALTPFVRRWSTRRGFVDHPAGAGSHKTHPKSVPFGGGIAITAAAVLPMAAAILLAKALGPADPQRVPPLTEWMPQWPYWLGGVRLKAYEGLAIIAGALVLHLVGLVDDHRPLPPAPKLLAQVAVALALTAGVGIRAGEALGPGPAIVLTTLWIVGITNAFNFLDNMDGLSAGVAALAALVLAISALLAGQVFVPCVLLLVGGAVLGFLIYNFPPASIFMGDAGSLVIGYLLAVFTVLITFYDPRQERQPFGVLVPLVVFAVPIYDMSTVMWRRYRTGRSVFRSDRGHFSHRLVKLGMSPTSAVLTIYLATAATALPAILLPQLNWPRAMLVLGQCFCVVAIIAILESRDGR